MELIIGLFAYDQVHACHGNDQVEVLEFALCTAAVKELSPG